MRQNIDTNATETLNQLWIRLQSEGFDVDHLHAVTEEGGQEFVNHLQWSKEPEVEGVFADWNGVEYVGDKPIVELGLKSLVADEWHER